MLKKWGFKPSINNIILILLCAAINIAGRYTAKQLFLPIWLDSVGTFLAAVMLGQVSGFNHVHDFFSQMVRFVSEDRSFILSQPNVTNYTVKEIICLST